MEIKLIAKADLSAAQIAAVRSRLDAPEHDLDWRELQIANSWDHFPPDRVFAYVAGDVPIGVVAVTGPTDAIDPAWWIDTRWRGHGHGRSMIDALAVILIAQGVTATKSLIMIASGPSDPASRKLVDRLRSHLKR